MNPFCLHQITLTAARHGTGKTVSIQVPREITGINTIMALSRGIHNITPVICYRICEVRHQLASQD